jgi:hypothetical protein
VILRYVPRGGSFLAPPVPQWLHAYERHGSEGLREAQPPHALVQCPALHIESISVSTGPRTVVIEYRTDSSGRDELTVELLAVNADALIQQWRVSPRGAVVLTTAVALRGCHAFAYSCCTEMP